MNQGGFQIFTTSTKFVDILKLKRKKGTTKDCGSIRRVGSKVSMNESVLVNSVNYEAF